MGVERTATAASQHLVLSLMDSHTELTLLERMLNG